MTDPQFSDEPRMIESKGNRSRLIFIFLFAVLLLAAVLYIPLFNGWQEEQSHLAERGKYQGAVYTIPIQGSETPVELGWAGPRLALAMENPIPGDDISVEVKGSFGEEMLEWNDEYSFYGPTEATMDPNNHHKVKITIKSGDEILWSGKKWAWGIHSHDHHH